MDKLFKGCFGLWFLFVASLAVGGVGFIVWVIYKILQTLGWA